MKRILISLMTLLGLSVSAQNYYVGQFSGLDVGSTGIVNQAGQNIDQRAATAAANVVSNLPLVELVHGTNHTYFALVESAVSNAVYGDTVNLSGIINAYTNIPIPGGVTINFRGATVTNNVNLNVGGPLFLPTGIGATINGPGSIYPAADHATVYHACFGFENSLGNASATNWLINGMSLYGDSDVIFCQHTNYWSGYIKNCLISSLTNGAWDIAVAYNTNNIGYFECDNDQFYLGPVVSSLGGSSLRGIGVGGVQGVFNNCTVIADGTTTVTHCFDTAITPGCIISNVLNNVNMVVLGANASYGYYSQLSGNTTFNGGSCTINSSGVAIRDQLASGYNTNYINNFFVYGTGAPLQLGAVSVAYNIGGNIRANQVLTTPYNFVDETGQSWLQVTNGVPSIIPPNGFFISNTNGATFKATNNALLQF